MNFYKSSASACARLQFLVFGGRFFPRTTIASRSLALDFFMKPTRRPAAAADFAGGKAFERLNRFVKPLPFCLKLGNHLMQVHEICFPNDKTPASLRSDRGHRF